MFDLSAIFESYLTSEITDKLSITTDIAVLVDLFRKKYGGVTQKVIISALYWKNVFGFEGEHYINFIPHNKFHIMGANTSGKSSIFNILTFALVGDKPGYINNPQRAKLMVCNKNCNNGEVVCLFSISDTAQSKTSLQKPQEYFIHRTIFRDGKTKVRGNVDLIPENFMLYEYSRQFATTITEQVTGKRRELFSKMQISKEELDSLTLLSRATMVGNNQMQIDNITLNLEDNAKIVSINTKSLVITVDTLPPKLTISAHIKQLHLLVDNIKTAIKYKTGEEPHGINIIEHVNLDNNCLEKTVCQLSTINQLYEYKCEKLFTNIFLNPYPVDFSQLCDLINCGEFILNFYTYQTTSQQVAELNAIAQRDFAAAICSFIPYAQFKTTEWLTQEWNTEINKCDNSLRVQIEPFKIFHNEAELQSDVLSGYQRFILDLTFRRIMTDSILLIDEGFGYCDTTNLHKVTSYLYGLDIPVMIISNVSIPVKFDAMLFTPTIRYGPLPTLPDLAYVDMEAKKESPITFTKDLKYLCTKCNNKFKSRKLADAHLATNCA